MQSENPQDHTPCRRPGFNPWVRTLSWRNAQQPIPVFLPRKSHRQRSLVSYSPQGCKELDTTEVTQHTCNHYIDKRLQLNFYFFLRYRNFCSNNNNQQQANKYLKEILEKIKITFKHGYKCYHFMIANIWQKKKKIIMDTKEQMDDQP